MVAVELDHGALLRACAQGDQSAFKTLYEQEVRCMLALATRILRRRDESEEVVHDAFVQIWNNASRFDGELGSGRAWMFSILRYRALNRLRAKSEFALGDDEQDNEVDEAPQPDEAAHTKREVKRLDVCLEGLEDQRRSPLLLAFYQGLSHGQIASKLATPLGTIKSRIRAGLRALQECLQT